MNNAMASREPEAGLSDRTQEVASLRRQISELIKHASDNQALSRRIQQFELRLLAAREVTEMLGLLLQDFVDEFTVCSAALVLYDPDQEVDRMLAESTRAERLRERGLVTLDQIEPLTALFRPEIGPSFHNRAAGSLADWLPGKRSTVKSLVALPLTRREQLFGALILASDEADRFVMDNGTDLLERLASIFSLAYENNLYLERLKKAGLLDPLTSVNNRRFFEQRIIEEVERAQRRGSSLVCLMMDIDHFKSVNDRYGHQAGDEVLRKVANLLTQMMRRSDVLARYGGEEFIGLLPDTPIQVAREVAERIRGNIEKQEVVFGDGSEIGVTLSIGLAAFMGGGHSVKSAAEELVARADGALYQAKASGRNRICGVS